MAEAYAHQSSSSSSKDSDSEAEVRIIVKNFNISVYKVNRRPLNYLYHVCVNLRASEKENVRANWLVYSVADDARVQQGIILVRTK